VPASSHGGTRYDDGAWSPFSGDVFLIDADGAVRRVAHHRSSKYGYWVQPRASLSEDGRYAIFASDWLRGAPGWSPGSCRAEAYPIDLSGVLRPHGGPAGDILVSCEIWIGSGTWHPER